LIAGKEKIAEYFEGLLEKHGDHYLSLDWKSKESQLVRFSVLLDIISFTDKKEDISILDVGCGIGHFYEFMASNDLIKRLKIKYTGIDISKKMVDFAKKKSPKINFQTVDLINDKFGKKFDYVMSSGAFNIRMADVLSHKASVNKMISRMFNISTHGVAVNFLSRSSIYMIPPGMDAEAEKYVYFSEEEVIKWVKAVCDRYILRKDYHPGDFTVYMLK
jgi:2-polyprenyl-3-methyl-5-hydroxy-6-metoxy-1,4-benzoquinol methylase